MMQVRVRFGRRSSPCWACVSHRIIHSPHAAFWFQRSIIFIHTLGEKKCQRPKQWNLKEMKRQNSWSSRQSGTAQCCGMKWSRRSYMGGRRRGARSSSAARAVSHGMFVLCRGTSAGESINQSINQCVLSMTMDRPGPLTQCEVPSWSHALLATQGPAGFNPPLAGTGTGGIRIRIGIRTRQPS
jgi:hypothetical protein